MPEKKPTSSATLYEFFVRQPDDVAGMVAFALYQWDEIVYIDQESPNLEELGIFRAVAMTQIEGPYLGRSHILVENYCDQIKGSGPLLQSFLRDVKSVKHLIHDAEIEAAINEILDLLDKLPDSSELRQDIGVISATISTWKKGRRKVCSPQRKSRLAMPWPRMAC